jgi:hypothetical protein
MHELSANTVNTLQSVALWAHRGAMPAVPTLPAPSPEPVDSLRILAVDNALIAVDKPSGLPSVPGRTPELALPRRVGGAPPGHGDIRRDALCTRLAGAAGPEPRL